MAMSACRRPPGWKTEPAGAADCSRHQMRVDKPTAVQIIVAWRHNRWVVSRDAVEVGRYAYRNHAMEMARALAGEIRAEGLDCYLLIREPDGRWDERRCPRPPKKAGPPA